MEINPLASVVLAPGQVRLKGAEGPRTFFGEFIASSTSDNGARPNKPNWTELGLYRKTDNPDYVLHVVARSVVYHDMDGCDRGIEVNLGEMAVRYLDPRCTEPLPEPCDKCHPMQLTSSLVHATTVMAEVDWHILHVCETVQDVLENLRQKGDGNKYGVPARILIDRARLVDPAIDAAFTQDRPL